MRRQLQDQLLWKQSKALSHFAEGKLERFVVREKCVSERVGPKRQSFEWEKG
jgi:hypothetical protein